MDDKPITVIVSDLHLGGGATDPGDDHVYHKSQFYNLITKELAESHKGAVELFINGDFLEFAQSRPEVYTLGSSKYWCSEEESLLKLEAIIAGHADIFDALKDFQAKGNRVTMAAGNHDVDLYWEGVQTRIREVAGPVEFELGEVWYYRYGNRLMIGHGHMFDPANSFKKWGNPILKDPEGNLRLEMCPGTLFMVKFVNWLEKDYPFADNIKPISALGHLLYNEQRSSFKAAFATLFHFAKDHPVISVGIDQSKLSNDKLSSMVGEQIIDEIALNETFARQIMNLYYEIGRTDVTIEDVRRELSTVDGVFNFLRELIVKVNPEKWMPIFDIYRPGALSIDEKDETTLSVFHSGVSSDKEILNKEAQELLSLPGREVVVCGHTHQPDEWRGNNSDWDGGYFNPGSWTRYADISKAKKLTLEDLKREEDFPYQLNYIRVEQSSKGTLRSDKICYDKCKGSIKGS
jgi:UDP-2,3-diacylglucosamine pyrophosphatase LpxH